MTFSREILGGPTLEAARALIGAHLVRDRSPGDPAARRVGRIVEVEAYIGEADAASHARFGPTNRNRVMFGPAGVAYVYLVYGMYECLNVVTEADGRPAAILVRAVEPVEGAAAMRSARLAQALRRAGDPAATDAAIARIARLTDARLASGPGLLAAAFDITRAETGHDLLDPAESLRLEPGRAPERVAVTARVGIGYAAEPWRSHPWRFLDPGSPSVSAAPGRART